MIRNILWVLLGGCSFGILSTFVKLAYRDGFSLADVTSAQAYFGAGILWLFLCLFRLFSPSFRAREGRKDPANAWQKQRTRRMLIVTGMAAGAISICYYKCVSLLPASIAIILLMQYTWISLLMERIIFKKKLHLKTILSLAVILLGTVLGSGLLNGTGEVLLNWAGVGYGLLAGFFYAIFILSNGYVGNQLYPIQKSSWIVLGVCIFIMVVFPPFKFLANLAGPAGSGFGPFFQSIWPWGLLLGFFGMVLPPLLFAMAIPKVGVALGSILGAVELPTAAICAYFLLDETLSWLQLLGILLILLAIVIINLQRKVKPKRENVHSPQ